MSKADIIGRNVRDYENKAVSLYNNGYKEGKNDGYALGKESGIKEAWELVRELENMSWERFSKVFLGNESIWDVICSLDFWETKHCLEDFAEDELKAFEVGDEVKDENGLIGVITNADTHYHIFYPHNGKTWKAPKNARLKKTGVKKHVTPMNDTWEMPW